MSTPERLDASDFVIPEPPATPSGDAGRRWIVIPQWEGFQHRDAARVVVPTWIKLYTELISKDEFLGLSFHLRGVLISLWIEYATSKRQLRDNTVTVSRRLGHRVTRRDLDSLNRAGFIEFSASKPASTSAGMDASIREEKRKISTLSTQLQPEAVEISSRSSKDVAREDSATTFSAPPPDTEWWHAQQTERERERRERSGYVDNLSSYTGVRIVRGEVGMSYVYDPLGTEPPPNDWPHLRPTKGEVLVALRKKG